MGWLGPIPRQSCMPHGWKNHMRRSSSAFRCFPILQLQTHMHMRRQCRVSVAEPTRWVAGSQIPGDGPMLSVWLAAVDAENINECGPDMELPPCNRGRINPNQKTQHDTCAENTAPESKRRHDRRSRSGLGDGQGGTVGKLMPRPLIPAMPR